MIREHKSILGIEVVMSLHDTLCLGVKLIISYNIIITVIIQRDTKINIVYSKLS